MSKEPCFWEDVLESFPLCQQLVSNYAAIKEEVLHHINTNNPLIDYPKYRIYDKRTGNIDLYYNYWKAFPYTEFADEFISNSPEYPKSMVDAIIARNKASCPTLYSVVQELESKKILANGFVSQLLPGSTLNPHRGWTDNWMRIHLCIKEDPGCVLTVGDQSRTWQEGKVLAFKDGGPYLHSVKHSGATNRIVVSMDVSIDYLKTLYPELQPW